MKVKQIKLAGQGKLVFFAADGAVSKPIKLVSRKLSK